MIGTAGQYLFSFSVGEHIDFLTEEDLHFFRLIEESSNILPTWEVVFTTKDNQIAKYFHEGNVFSVSYGVSEQKLVDTELVITAKEVVSVGYNSWKIEAAGTYNRTPFITIPHVRIYDDQSGIQVLHKLASKYFDIDSNINESADSQNWIQPNSTDKRFLDYVWLHSYIPESFICVGITMDGRYVIRDVIKVLKDEPAFKFANNGTDTPYSILSVESISGFTNAWQAYGREIPFYVHEPSKRLIHKPTFTPSLAMSAKGTRQYNVHKRGSTQRMLNRNSHTNYHVAEGNNLLMLAAMSSEKATLTFDSHLNDIKVLDLVMIVDAEANSPMSVEAQSGLYLTSKVVRTVDERRFFTTIEAVRETVSDIKGKLRAS